MIALDIFFCQLFLVFNIQVFMAIDVFISNTSYTWDEAVEQMPCKIVDEEFYLRLQNASIESVTILNNKNQPISETEGWIGAYEYRSKRLTSTYFCCPGNPNLGGLKFLANDPLEMCYKHCSNSTFFMTNTLIHFLTTSCQGQFCDINGQNYFCGTEITQSQNQCMCQYKNKNVIVQSWEIPPPPSTQKAKCLQSFIDKIGVYTGQLSCDSKLPVFCSSLSTQEIQTTEFPPKIATMLEKTDQGTQTTEFSPTITTMFEKLDQVEDNTIAIYIGLGTGMLLVIIIMIVVIVIWRRKQSSKGNHAPTNSNVISMNSIVKKCDEKQNASAAKPYSEVVMETSKDKNNTKGYQGGTYDKNSKIDDYENNIAIGNRTVRENCTGGKQPDPDPLTDSLYNVLHEETKSQDLSLDVYDHVPNVRDGEYNTLDDLQDKGVPNEICEYDSMNSTEYHTLNNMNNQNFPQEMSEYDSMSTTTQMQSNKKN